MTCTDGLNRVEKARTVLERLRTLLQWAPPEPGRFVSYFSSRAESIDEPCETGGKSGNRIERRLVSTFSDRREPGPQGRLSQMGALPAHRRIMTCFKCFRVDWGGNASNVLVSIQSRKSSGICFVFHLGEQTTSVMAKDFRQILQAFEFQGDIILPRKPGFSGPAWCFFSSKHSRQRSSRWAFSLQSNLTSFAFHGQIEDRENRETS